jgi:lipopolysaccharide biosynthesis glycosyltransferase
MTTKDLETLVQQRFTYCQEVLFAKNAEYAREYNVLSNFHLAATLQDCPATQALMGMAAKHIVSLFTFAQKPWSHTLEQWQEKITDIINYCLLLEAMAVEWSKLRQPPVEAHNG